jgi:hypothetical protein
MSWEQEISQKLQEAQNIAIRFDIVQQLTETQKATACANVDATATAAVVSGDDYRITFKY